MLFRLQMITPNKVWHAPLLNSKTSIGCGNFSSFPFLLLEGERKKICYLTSISRCEVMYYGKACIKMTANRSWLFQTTISTFNVTLYKLSFDMTNKVWLFLISKNFAGRLVSQKISFPWYKKGKVM